MAKKFVLIQELELICQEPNKIKINMLQNAAYFLLQKIHNFNYCLIKFSMLKGLLSERIFNVIESNYDVGSIYEVRIRNNCPVVINYKGIMVAIKTSSGKLIIASSRDIERVISVASNYSLYTVENQIKQAFITAQQGYRIGLTGEIVGDCNNSCIRSIKNIYSVNIRIPHKIENCSYKIFKYIYSGGEIKSTLIISPPGAGKTTYLRDICYQFSKHEKPVNILLIDERYEIAGVKDGVSSIDIGGYCDILSGASKSYGFNQGIRALRPDVIVTDELMGKDDCKSVIDAINSGVSVIATVHANSIEMIKEKNDFTDMIENRYFDRYILLSTRNGPGSVESVYDKNLKCMFC